MKIALHDDGNSYKNGNLDRNCNIEVAVAEEKQRIFLLLELRGLRRVRGACQLELHRL